MSGWVGGLVDIPIIINPLHTPNFMIKIQLKLILQVGPECGNILDTFRNFPKTFKQLKNTFQTYARHLPNIFHTPFRHLSVILPTAPNSFHTPTQKAIIVYKISAIRRVRGVRAYNQSIKGLSYLVFGPTCNIARIQAELKSPNLTQVKQ